MSDTVLTPEFEEVLLHDVLPGKARPLPANQALSLKTVAPDFIRLGEIKNGKYFVANILMLILLNPYLVIGH